MRRARRYLTAGLAVALFIGATVPESPLADAAMRGDVAGVRSLLSDGAEVNAPRGDGMTALHWAAQRGSVEIARLLIQAGARVDVLTRIGDHTPLHVAARAGHEAVIGDLLAAGADVNSATATGATALHFASASGRADAIRLLLAGGADADAREPEWGQTPLMFAAAAGRVEAVRALLEGGADPTIAAKVLDIAARDAWDRGNRRDREARVAAIRAGSSVREVARGAGPPLPGDLSAETREAAERAGGEPVAPSCSGCLGNYADLVSTHGGLTALLLASREGHADAAFALIEGGADINQLSAADRTSPMLIAMINGHFDLALRLFEAGADPKVASAAGATPLYAALNMQWAPKSRHPQPTDYQQQEASYLEVMETLLVAGVDPNARLEKSLWFSTYNRDLFGVDRTGATAFWRAAHALDIDAMKLLLAHGADPSLPTIKVPVGRAGLRPDRADHSGLPPALDGGPAVYPIHAAAGVGYGQGFAGNSHRHVPDGWLPAMKFLVEELGADVNARDHDGYTPLHHAAARGDNEMIRYLVERGADATLVSRSGQTTVDLANGPVQRVEPFPETIALLESLGAKNNHNCVSC